VEIWLERVLAKDPDDRFSDANEMSLALEAAMRGKAPPPLTKTVVAPSWSEKTTRQSPPVFLSSSSQSVQKIFPTPSPPSAAQRAQEIYPPPATIPQKVGFAPWLIAAFIIVGIGAVAIAALIIPGIKGTGPLAMLSPATATKAIEIVVVDRPTDTPLPTFTIESVQTQAEVIKQSPTPSMIPPTQTELPPTPTTEPTSAQAPKNIGGADKIAFLNANDIWLIDVDGSNLIQLTNDGAEKTNLGWYPDGSAITYISGKCIWYVEVESTRIDQIACFESTEYLETFTFSPDGSQVAISVNRELYVVPWDLEKLRTVRYNRDLAAMSECPSLAPLRTASNTSEPVKRMRWSNDGQRIIILKLANIQGKLGDLIQIFNVQSCDYSPIRIDEIPASRFTLEGYDEILRIQNFGFDGNFLLAMVSYTRNDGFGHLYIYNTDLHRADMKVNPINGECCYRDPQFSPDGRYLIFVYQPFVADARSQLYYIPFGTIGSGANYEPIPLPDSFFENAREKPQPILRPVQ
jgi:hypothetical protein